MKLYNTLTRKIDTFTPLADNTVKIYTCGLTVYSQPHIGNWTGYIYWNILVRSLRAEGYKVIRTQNITDVGHLVSDDDSGEDKMEKGAKREGVTAWDVADKYIQIADHEAYGLLGLERPDHLVRATDYIKQQIAFAVELEERGYTYLIPNEGLYFDTSKLADYGKLARLDIAGLEAGARVSIEGKRNITDFAIWKLSPQNQQRDMEWDSPWGKGFPGWHLECSVIARETLGDQIDIHTGGIDHIPVHHTNEIAQTEAITSKQFSQFWLHNNHIKVDGTKISKSLGNIYTLADIQSKGFEVDAFKLMVLSKHYRTEGNFTWEILAAAQNRLTTYRQFADVLWQLPDMAMVEGKTSTLLTRTKQAIMAALDDDLNTPQALTALGELESKWLTVLNEIDRASFLEFLQFLDSIFGLHLAATTDITPEQYAVVAQREQAKQVKDWARADELREQLQQQGIGLRDVAGHTVWHRLQDL